MCAAVLSCVFHSRSLLPRFPVLCFQWTCWLSAPATTTISVQTAWQPAYRRVLYISILSCSPAQVERFPVLTCLLAYCLLVHCQCTFLALNSSGTMSVCVALAVEDYVMKEIYYTDHVSVILQNFDNILLNKQFSLYMSKFRLRSLLNWYSTNSP